MADLKECWSEFIADLSCSILKTLNNFLTTIGILLSTIILRKELEITNLLNSKLAYARALFSLLDVAYGAILSTLDILGEYIKQYDYCDVVGDVMDGAKRVLDDKISPYLKSAKDIRNYLLLEKLKTLEVTELKALKTKLQEMNTGISNEISSRCQ